ncbi:unnamed protein product [Caenorhabditis angaria]|uniref:Piwi domain-containing protein n=1 Tax=Caenorhabditis angaria TaxID=860376 RepID=A0A9P1N8P2_9PELO|nr:unnamed protein product [Caenorhabditis angaria]
MSERDVQESFSRMNMYDDTANNRAAQRAESSTGRRSPGNEQPGPSGTQNYQGSEQHTPEGTITLEKTTSILKRDMMYQTQTFVERPGVVGKLGEKTKLVTNYITFKTNAQPIRLYQYNIQVLTGTREEKKRSRCTARFWECVQEYRHFFPNNITDILYNGVNMLWVKEQLKVTSGDVQLKLHHDDGRDAKTTIHIKFASTIEFSENATLEADRDLFVTIADAIVSQRSRCPIEGGDGLLFTAHENGMYSSHFRDPHNIVKLKIELGKTLEAWTGLHFAAKLQLQMGPCANIDLCHTVFMIPEYSLIRMMLDIAAGRKISDEEYENEERRLQNYGISEGNKKDMKTILHNKTICINYGNGRAFKFKGISDGSADQTFFTFEGREMSIAQYFQSKGINLRFPHFPCIIGPQFRGQESPSLFPLEFVTTAKQVQKHFGRLPDHQLAPMIRGTAYPPCDRFRIVKTLAIDGLPDQVPPLIENDPWMRNFDLEIGKEFIHVDATILPPPTLRYGNLKFFDEYHHGVWLPVVEDEGFKKVLTARCTTTHREKKIIPAIITIENPRLNPQNVAFDHGSIQCLMETVSRFGQPVYRNRYNQPATYFVGAYHQGRNRIEELRNMLVEIKTRIENDRELSADGSLPVPLVLFIFAYRSTTIRTRTLNVMGDYGIIKQLCDGEVGINCQGILRKNLATISGNPNRCSTAHNMAMKILSKIGTTHYMIESGGKHKNWTKLTNPKEPTLVLGIDVTHPSDIDNRMGGKYACSIAAVVGNIDVSISKFGESVRIQERGLERIVKMDQVIEERIKEFIEYAGIRPAHIVIYRDGVSETEFKRILYEERTAIERVCKSLDKDYEPTFTYIVVSKRHHTRFCALRESDTEGKAYNIKPGTLVESQITTKKYFDFYLASQFGPLGTTRPTHYYVLADSWKPSNAFWQTITYALTYAYVRTCKSISIPAPVMYAHLCAKRARDRFMAYFDIAEQRGIHVNMLDFEDYMRVLTSLKPHDNLKKRGMLYC